MAIDSLVANKHILNIESITSFSEDATRLYVYLKEKDFPPPSQSPVDVWSYTDVKLQSVQKKELSPRTYAATIDIKNQELIRLENDNEKLAWPRNPDEWELIENRPGDPSEAFWNTRRSSSVFLISTKSGIRKKIAGLDNLISGKISAKGKYVVYYQPEQKSWFSYEIESGVGRNVTHDLPVTWLGYSIDQPVSGNYPRGIAGWVKEDEAVLIYDENDIWQIDMAGKKAPLNITNGYGKKHNIVFALSSDNYYNKDFSNNERLIINAFNLGNKDNGFYSITISKTGDPELLSMGPYLFDIPGNPYIPSASGFSPVKAREAEVYLVRRMKANEAPNVYSTTDFKTFTQLSDVHPEKNYNWLSSELITWKGLDGSLLQGILYKPENFDPGKKYPIIFHYYEKRSDGLHAFLEPGVLSGFMNINVPMFVSNGYLVFVPDIRYKIGETGESVLNSIISAAKYLTKLPFINAKKMGIQGGSFGGYETNYLVTHTNIFAAACSSSGLSNLVSTYGALYDGDGASEQGLIDFGIFRMGATLWQRPNLYIKNSPIFKVDKVTTPLLVMHTKHDGVCPFIDAVSFFTALRRLNKKAWMLVYDGNHLIQGKSALDFSTRMQQFFDHYLKDEPAPKWMLEGIPAKVKGIDDGLELIKERDPNTGKWITPGGGC